MPSVEAALLACCLAMLGRYNLPFEIVGPPFNDSCSCFAGWVSVWRHCLRCLILGKVQ
jgi:hypothetical protein